MMSYTETIEKIKKLPHYREYTCQKCGHKQRAYILEIQRNCEICGIQSKLRAHAAIGSEVEDVIDTVLEWLGQENEFEDAMEWKQVIDSSEE